MDAFCQSFGEVIMDGEGDVNMVEVCFTWLDEDGENIPAGVFSGDRLVSGGLPLSPGDKGAIAEEVFIAELYIWVQISCSLHTT